MTRVPKTEKGKETMNRILNAAMDLFYEKGYAHTSIIDITQRARVAYGLFYMYFKSKDNILEELVKKINRELRYYLKTSIGNISDRIEVEKIGFTKYFEWINNNKRMYKIFIETEAHRPELYTWNFMKIAEGYAKGLKEAMNKGQIINVNPELLAFSLIGMSDFIAKRYILWYNEGISDKLLQDIYKILENMLRPR